MCILATFALTYGLDLNSPIKWEIRCAAIVFFSVVTFFPLYGLQHIIKISTWHAVIAFASMIIIFVAVSRVMNDFVTASISDLGTVYLLLKMPIAAIGLFGGAGSLLLARAFWVKGRTMINVIMAGYFFVTGAALVLSYFLMDMLSGLMRLLLT